MFRYFIGLMFSAALLPAASIGVQPSASMVPLGGAVSATVNVVGLSDLYAFQFDILFNPGILSAVSVIEGPLFNGLGVFFSPGFIDNAGGTIAFISDSLSGPGPGISVDGALVQILFAAIGPGLSNIDVSNVVLLDSGLNDITAIASGVAITVIDNPAIPEPGTLSLISSLVLLGYSLSGLTALWRNPAKFGVDSYTRKGGSKRLCTWKIRRSLEESRKPSETGF